jgi:hypothetical protein
MTVVGSSALALLAHVLAATAVPPDSSNLNIELGDMGHRMAVAIEEQR